MSPVRGRIRELEDRLAESEGTIKALLSEQVDAVVDARNGSPMLLAKAQAALRDSEERYRRILETTKEGVWLTDASGQTTFMNGSMTEMLGCVAVECLGKRYVDFLDADESRRLAAYLAHPSEAPIELRFERTDGKATWALLSAVAVRDQFGAVDGTLATVTDITEGRLAAKALRTERDRAQRFLDTADVFLVALDLAGKIELVNRYACAAIGQTAESLIGRPWLETCVPARLHSALRAEFAAVLGGDLTVKENQIISSNGEERRIEWHNTLLRDDTGKVTGTFSSGVDITDRQRSAEDLRKAEEWTRFALQSANIGTWDQDYGTDTLKWSEILEAQYGFAPGGFDGSFGTFAALIHPADRDEVLATIAAAAQAGGDFAVHHRILRTDGTLRHVEGVGRVVLDAAGQPLRAVGISQDVTEREDLERQYQHSQKMEAFGQLAGGIAHDFNNILSVILSCGEFLLTDLKEQDPSRVDAEEIVKAGLRAADLTRQLLMFSRKQVLAPRVFDLAAVTDHMSGMLSRLVGEDVVIQIQHDTVAGCVRADPGSIEQVILNLVVNARDAMPAGGTLTIETSNEIVSASPVAGRRAPAIAPGRYVVLSVSDSGVGMDEATQLRVFEPFFTTKEQGKGTGLGLSTVFGIVQQNHGAIEVWSSPGAGAKFSVYLPQVDEAPDEAPIQRSLTGARGTETILLVEDEDQVRAVTRAILERHGYVVIEMRTGADALAHCLQGARHIDLLLTDVVMPLMGGPELGRRVVEILPHVKVLWMSGYTDDSVIRHGVLKGATPFLQKPFTSAGLTQKVREVLDGKIPDKPAPRR